MPALWEQGEGQAVIRVCLWSGPRNASTALMYAFAQRADTRVVDEPLYAHYLWVSGADHPGRDEILAAMDSEGERVVRQVILGPCDRPVLFLKQMAHHLTGLDWGFLERTANVLLVRDPADVLPSLARRIPEPSLVDTGLAIQTKLLRHLRSLGQPPHVLDARELLRDPEGVLRQLCERLGLAFDPSMLHWEPGPRPEEGVWAGHWYATVHRSHGFEARALPRQPLPERLAPLLEECRPHYEELAREALRSQRQ